MEGSPALAEEGRAAASRQATPVQVSELAWFYVRYRAGDGKDEDDVAFVVQRYSDVKRLLKGAEIVDPSLYIFSEKLDGAMSLRRVVAVRAVPRTDLTVFELDDGHGLVLNSGDDTEAALTFAEIDAPVSVDASQAAMPCPHSDLSEMRTVAT